MAETDVGAVVGAVVGGLIAQIKLQISYALSYKKNVKNLISELEDMEAAYQWLKLSVYEHQNNMEVIAPEVEEWLVHMEDIKIKSEEILDLALKEGVADDTCFIFQCPNPQIAYSISRKATKNAVVLVQLREELKRLSMMESVYGTGSKVLLSTTLKAREIVNAVISHEYKVIGVCGPDIRKTKIVNQIATRARSGNKFDKVAISVVGRHYDVSRFQDELAQMFSLEFEEGSITGRAERLRARLSMGKMILIILVDIFNSIDLKELGIPFEDEFGCKVIVTSQSESVCTDTGAQKNFKVGKLSEPEDVCAIEELPEHAEELPEHGEELPEHGEELSEHGEELSEHGEELSENGEDLHNGDSDAKRKRNQITLDDALKQIRKSKTISLTQREKYSKVLSTYNKLEENQAKLLFQLCCQFPEGEVISIETLTRYALGIHSSSESETVESSRENVRKTVESSRENVRKTEESSRENVRKTLKSSRDDVCNLIKELKDCGLLVEDGQMFVKVQDTELLIGKSIASIVGNMYMVKHDSKHKEFPETDKYEPYTALSFHSNEMHEIPAGLDCSKVELLWLANNDNDGTEVPAEFFEGMMKLKVVDFRVNFVKPLPLSLKFLRSLRTLCLDFCRLPLNISFIGSLKKLEILSFFRSKLDVLPGEIRRLSNLKLLDLRCSVGPRIVRAGVLSSLRNLEELYTGSYFGVTNAPVHKKRNSAKVKELNSLSRLKVLQISVNLDKELLDRKLTQFKFENLTAFDISRFEMQALPYPQPLLLNVVGFYRVDIPTVLNFKITPLMKMAEKLILRELDDSSKLVLELGKEVFAKLNSLHISSCQGLQYVINATEDSVANNAICDVKSLEIAEMDNLTDICHGNLPVGSFSKLEEASLIKLPNLMNIWTGHIQSPSLSNLKVFIMQFCQSIKTVFSNSAVKCLEQLQELTITECKMLRHTVSTEVGEDGDLIKFPKLKLLTLSNLPNFRNFFYSHLTHDGSTVGSLLNKQVLLPSLEVLDLRRLSNHVRIACKDVQVNFLPSLRVLKVSECKSVEAVFESQKSTHEGQVSQVTLDHLESIELHGLPMLKDIWRTIPDGLIQGLSNLRSLDITSCGRMNYLLLLSTAKLIVNLEELKITRCKMMKQVIEPERVSSSEPEMMEKMVFAKLRVLELKDMRDLVSFWDGQRYFELPQLEKVFITKCPNMVTFYDGSLCTPKLKRVQIEHLDVHEWVWKDNLNSTIRNISERG